MPLRFLQSALGREIVKTRPRQAQRNAWLLRYDRVMRMPVRTDEERQARHLALTRLIESAPTTTPGVESG
jgi:hypothetical protein